MRRASHPAVRNRRETAFPAPARSIRAAIAACSKAIGRRRSARPGKRIHDRVQPAVDDGERCARENDVLRHEGMRGWPARQPPRLLLRQPAAMRHETLDAEPPRSLGDAPEQGEPGSLKRAERGVDERSAGRLGHAEAGA
jgi:hypothetical protein